MNTYRVVSHLDKPSKGRADQVFNNIENVLEETGGGMGVYSALT